MEQERKDKGLSRRGFLKGLGGGAIGTAVISTGLLNGAGRGLYARGGWHRQRKVASQPQSQRQKLPC